MHGHLPRRERAGAAARAGRTDRSWREFRHDLPIAGKRERRDADHSTQRKLSIKMWKQGAAARGLPFQGMPKPVSVDGNQDEVVLIREMATGCFRKLLAA